MKQVLLRKGVVFVEEVPPPALLPGTALIDVSRSCISVGTEMSGVRASNMPIWKRALSQPENVKKVLDHVRASGLSETRRLVQHKLDTAHPLGYSACGRVTALGEGVDDFVVGDLVACAGSQHAHHAESICVPTNLVVRVPDNVREEEAATITLGAIALQGVRRANPTLGETFLVIGLGLIGQITVQLLRSNGVSVIGVDLDSNRVEQAKALGLDFGFVVGDSSAPEEQMLRRTDGYGVDAVIVTAASASNEVLTLAFKSCRRKGRVVLVGDVPIEIDRTYIYEKELDFLISTSYGPGRYDRVYEEKGLDYPLPYVRWTENRNMQAYLSLMADGRIDVGSLVETVYPVEEAAAAYAVLKAEEKRPLAVLLSYPDSKQREALAPVCSVSNSNYKNGRDGAIKLGIIGAGGFATGTLLPILSKHLDLFDLTWVVTRRGHTATNAARRFNAARAATDVHDALDDPEVDAVIIATRHHLHGTLVLKALEAGKHVFVEKPLCLTPRELADIEAFYEKEGHKGPLLLTGFNRRFSRYAAMLKDATRDRAGPMMINYRVNAGHIPLDHWVHGQEGGGRNLGEACHFYDFFTFLTASPTREIQALAVQPGTRHYGVTDNFSAQISFDDGSIASLTYTALGAAGHPKERVDVYVDGKVISIDDFKAFDGGADVPSFTTKTAEKGHEEELLAFGRVVREGGEWPIPLWQQVQSTSIAFAVERAITK